MMRLGSRYPQCEPAKLMEGFVWLYHLNLDKMIDEVDKLVKEGTIYADWLRPGIAQEQHLAIQDVEDADLLALPEA
eukprot:NODE_4581_length_786_cov_32.180461_g3807_i0.p2 GENE.NODE_4581_length_786_cov_32.180461_g3807_i0~~NODE_4581_length_786_cov_32.180461_g3807_i0.p2  ORF type:complete len:87 (-),score=11.85 NODE_4581_length_786_cov_32.180461_g3807_i0:525-752(-)